METSETYQWLMENGGLVIRYRTATELMPPDKSLDVEALRNDLLQSPLVQKWLDNLKPPFLLGQKLTRQAEFTRASMEIHGAKDIALENVLGKLTDFGLKKGVPELDRRVNPYLGWLVETSKKFPHYFFVTWMRHEVADFLALAGYADEPEIQKLLKTRLDLIYDFARRGDYDIYTDPKKYKKMPGSFAGRPLIKPELTRNQIMLPLVYDIVGWGAYLNSVTDEEALTKADTVIEWILNEKYQAYPWGYGIIFDEASSNFWAMGWSIHMPGFSESLNGDLETQLRVLRLEQLAHFKAARRHPWFKADMEHLEQFKTERGAYLFPKEFLPEKPAAYWIVGGKMALEDNPRNKKKLEVESTFRMARLKKIIERD